MKPVLPFLIGGATCDRALGSLELLLRNALIQKTGFLEALEIRDQQVRGTNPALKTAIKQTNDEILLIEELILEHIPKARGSENSRRHRRRLVAILRAQRELMGERARKYEMGLRVPPIFLEAETKFFDLLIEVIEFDN
jgi:hypothetical protein